jgi:lipid-A-disaccharide synthase
VSKTIYFVAGEASGDNHGAELMRSLRQLDADLQFIGRGGPRMKTIAGGPFHDWTGDSAVLGLWEVIRKYGYFREKFRETLSEIEKGKPDAVVLIDYPGFNLRLSRALRSRMATRKIIYYISPQVWAWNRGRIKKMARFLDLMLCIFPFEADLYNQSGLRTVFVGHPMVERLRAGKSASRTDSSRGEIDIERDPNLIALFPGSRSREVRKIFPVLIEAADKLRRQKPNLCFEVAAASPELAREMEKALNQFLPRFAPPHLNPLPQGEGRVRAIDEKDRFEIKVGDAAAIMQRALVGIVASGSATLEAAYFRLPFVLIYKVAWPTYLAARLVVKVKYLGMPNVLAGKEVVPEFIQHRARPGVIARAVSQLIDDRAAREKMISEFDTIVAKLGEGEASDRAANAIVNELG